MTWQMHKNFAMDTEDSENFSYGSSSLMISDSLSSDTDMTEMDVEPEIFIRDTDFNRSICAPFRYDDESIPDFDKRYSLKKLKYPACAKAALNALADLASMGNIRGTAKLDIQTALINDYIFGKIEQLNARGIPRVHSEFQFINLLKEFICYEQRTPAIRNAIILSLFPCTDSSIDYLGNLICFAISLSHNEILDAAGTWMQQVGASSEYSQNLAMYIVDYFCGVAPDSMTNFIKIAEIAPHFTANLLTAIAEAHSEIDPTDQMLHLVNAWMNINPNILTASLTYCPVLPPGGIPMAPITAITGLFRWCIVSPTKQEFYYFDQSNVIICRRIMLYCAIYNKVLCAIESLKDSRGNRNAILAYDFEQIIYFLRKCCESKLPNISRASYNLAMDRLLEVLHVALAADCIYGNTQKLRNIVLPVENV